MDKMLSVLRQEYLFKVRTKAFVIGTLLFPLFIGAMFVLPALFMNIGVGKPMTLAVVDQTGVLFQSLDTALADTNQIGERLYTVVAEPPTGQNQEELNRDLGTRVSKGELGGFLILPPDLLDGGRASFFAETVSDFQRNEKIDRAVETAVREARIQRSNLDPGQVDAILKDIRLDTFKVSEGGLARKDEGATFTLAYFVGICLYLSLFIYGTMMLRVVLEEKLSRTAEVMVSTVRPTHLMIGKILGVGAVGLTQVGIWALASGLFALYGIGWIQSATGVTPDIGELGLTAPMVLFFVLFFVLGFLFYAAFYGAVGSMVNSEAESQQLQFPMSLPIVMAFMLMFLVIRDPSGTPARICSLVPFFSPILMPARICVVMPPAWEIAASVTILLLSITAAMWVAGRVFRVGILMYGKRPNLPELMKWIRYG